MKITKLVTRSDGRSYFEDCSVEIDSEQHLGLYSKDFPVSSFQIREFKSGLFYDWHNAPQEQYIIISLGLLSILTEHSRRLKANSTRRSFGRIPFLLELGYR